MTKADPTTTCTQAPNAGRRRGLGDRDRNGRG